jgi:hypothetical protein
VLSMDDKQIKITFKLNVRDERFPEPVAVLYDYAYIDKPALIQGFLASSQAQAWGFGNNRPDIRERRRYDWIMAGYKPEDFDQHGHTYELRRLSEDFDHKNRAVDVKKKMEEFFGE